MYVCDLARSAAVGFAAAQPNLFKPQLDEVRKDSLTAVMPENSPHAEKKLLDHVGGQFENEKLAIATFRREFCDPKEKDCCRRGGWADPWDSPSS